MMYYVLQRESKSQTANQNVRVRQDAGFWRRLAHKSESRVAQGRGTCIWI